MKKVALLFLPLLLTACFGLDKSAAPGECPDKIDPVCGKVQVQCITVPCDPIDQSFPNRCFAEAAGAEDIREGECGNGAKMTDEDKVKAALQKKREKEQIDFVIDEKEDNHMRGTFKGGGKFLMTKVGTEWIVVHEGKEPVDCSTAINYGFPEEMMEDCEWSK